MAKTRVKKNRSDVTKTNGSLPVLQVREGASLKSIYEAARRAFTAADLQKYAESEQGIPARQVLSELEALDREEIRKRSRKTKNARAR
jgi:hypothetical protein